MSPHQKILSSYIVLVIIPLVVAYENFPKLGNAFYVSGLIGFCGNALVAWINYQTKVHSIFWYVLSFLGILFIGIVLSFLYSISNANFIL